MNASDDLIAGALLAQRDVADDLCRAVFDFMEDEANDAAFDAMNSKTESYRAIRGYV